MRPKVVNKPRPKKNKKIDLAQSSLIVFHTHNDIHLIEALVKSEDNPSEWIRQYGCDKLEDTFICKNCGKLRHNKRDYCRCRAVHMSTEDVASYLKDKLEQKDGCKISIDCNIVKPEVRELHG